MSKSFRYPIPGLPPCCLDCELVRSGIGGIEDVLEGGPVPLCFAANDFRYHCQHFPYDPMRSEEQGRLTLSSFLINLTSSRKATSIFTPSLAEHSINGADNDFAISRPSN